MKIKTLYFRLVQVGRLNKTNGWNLMFGKTFIRSFHWSHKKEAIKCMNLMNNLIKNYPAENELIIKNKWIKPPHNNIITNENIHT